MTDYGVTDDGFVKKDLATIISEMNDDGINKFGDDLNTDPSDSIFGVLTGIYGDRLETLWDLAQSVYNAFVPSTAGGISLDNVISLTAITRLKATKTVVGAKVYGTKTTIIPVTFQASLSGDSTKRFFPQSSTFIGDGVNEIQKISFSNSPTAGGFTVIWEGSESNAIMYYDTAVELKAELEFIGMTNPTVTGNFITGFNIEFVGVDGEKPQTKISEGLVNTLFSAATPVTISFQTTQTGDLPSVEFDMEAENAGEVIVLANNLTVIDTPTLGIDSITNPLDGDAGREDESDAELRVRRIRSLQIAGNSTVDAIRANLLDIDDVRSVSVFENTSDVAVSGRPPHSYECVVQGGDDDELGQAVFDSKPAGIATTGNTAVVAESSIGQQFTVYFTRPSGVDIYCEVDLDTDNTAQRSDVTVDSVLDNQLYYVEINGTVFQFTTDGTATEGEILIGLKESINLGTEYVIASINGTTLEVLSTRPGQSFTVSVDSNLSFTTPVANVDADEFPVNGEDTVRDFILAYGDSLDISDDVLVWKLVSSFSSIAGINQVTVRIGTAASPTLDNNIPIGDSEIADFDSTRTTIQQV